MHFPLIEQTQPIPSVILSRNHQPPHKSADEVILNQIINHLTRVRRTKDGMKKNLQKTHVMKTDWDDQFMNAPCPKRQTIGLLHPWEACLKKHCKKSNSCT